MECPHLSDSVKIDRSFVRKKAESDDYKNNKHIEEKNKEIHPWRCLGKLSHGKVSR